MSNTMSQDTRPNFDTIRADIAEALEIAPEDIGPEDNLADLGLDSMRVMTLVATWEEQGMDLDFLPFAQDVTLAAWKDAFEAQSGA